MRDFTDKVAVITGAGAGIGRALAIALAERGARLALSDIDAVAVADTAATCEKLGATAVASALDVADRTAVHAHADQVVAEFGQVNLVVNNAGVALMATVEDMTWEDFEWIMGINFWGVVHGTKAFLPHLIASGDGHVVNLSSVFGLIGVPTQSAYNATKFGVRGFTDALRAEMLVAGHQVGVSCVHPGGIDTNIARAARKPDGMDDEEAARSFAKIAGTSPDDAAQAIIRGVERNSARILIGLDARVIDLLPRVFGSAYQRVIATGTGLSKRFGIDLG
ncbi:MAG: SDR family NAD(P)-dependent oxidoreductase, partial [Pseudonocardia sp.]|nr:SDR family NAD(P)-dependent oxidoreductase [Pseudonocardia sp.]